MRPLSTGISVLGILVLCTGNVCGQAYPSKLIRIVTTDPSGSVGLVARLVAQGISSPLGQSVIVDNRANAIAGELVAKAPADGYTLLVIGSTFWVEPLLQKKPYDPVTDFVSISTAASTPNILVVHPSLPVKSVRELIALAKGRPGELNYASGVAGSPTHLAGELFKSMAGVNIVHIGFKGGGPSMNALVGGEVQLMFPTAASSMPNIKSGRLRALAVTSSEPSPLAPGLPTVAASGLPGYEAEAATAIFAPAKTPEAIVSRLNQEVVRFLSNAEVKKQFFDIGAEAISSSPEQLTVKMKSEMARMGKVIKDAGIRVE